MRYRLFFDTNVLAYAHDRSSLFHKESRQLIEKVFWGEIAGVLSEQNLVELYRVLTNSTMMKKNPLSSGDACDLIKDTYLQGAFEIVYATRESLQICFDLVRMKNISSSKIFDMRLAGQIIQSKVDYFVTYNMKDFVSINGINVKTPSDIHLSLFI